MEKMFENSNVYAKISVFNSKKKIGICLSHEYSYIAKNMGQDL